MVQHKQHLDSLRQKDSLRGVEATEISVYLGNYSASHFEGSAINVLYATSSRGTRKGGKCRAEAAAGLPLVARVPARATAGEGPQDWREHFVRPGCGAVIVGGHAPQDAVG